MITNNFSASPSNSWDEHAITRWFLALRDKICTAFEELEQQHAHAQVSCESGKFCRTPWQRPGGGGGEMSLMRGRIFEKVGVNYSCVRGKLTPQFREKLPHTENTDEFWAAGISLVSHMHSPHIPAVHFNTRCIKTGSHWWGGGADMTPTFPDDEDTLFFHKTLKEACDTHNPTYYPKFKDWCDTYFFLPHRNEPRGIGGVFFDYHDTGNTEQDFAFVRDIGDAFLSAFIPIAQRNSAKEWTEAERDALKQKRGRYVEFNLLHDRGTKFGLETNGNIEAILMSLPPEASW